MTPLVVDFESYYSKEYSLGALTPPEYCMDPRFEAIGLSVKEGFAAPAYWVDGPDLPGFFRQAPRDAWFISHNMMFDGALAAWRYGYYPARYGCTLSMARAVLGPLLDRFNLNRVSVHLGLGGKLEGVLANAKGRSFADIKADPEYYRTFVAYGLNDCELCGLVFRALAPLIPVEEMAVIDMVTRCALQPKFELDQEILTQHLTETIQSKERLLAAAGFSERSALMSNPKLAEILRSYGIEPPTKISPATGKPTLAMAKNDEEFQDLLSHPNPAVQAIVAARLGVKSTIEETRARRFLAISRVAWPPWVNASVMPMPLRYGAAHTHRLGGDWDVNCCHPDVELLTPAGWQRVEDWQPATPVMQWWPNGSLTWEVNPTKVERATDAELVWFGAPFVKGGFTRDHRMVSLKGGRVVERTAGWVADHSGLREIPVAGTFVPMLPSSLLTPDHVRVLVALAADGSAQYRHAPRVYHPGGKIARPASDEFGGWQFGFHKQRKADRLRVLLTAAGVHFAEQKNAARWSFQVSLTHVPAWMQKGFGPWVLELSPSAMDALLDELVHWDGFPNSRSGQPTFCTTVREQALWVQTVAHLRNRPATVKCYADRIWHVYFRQGVLTTVGGKQVNVRPYTGKTYCPQVASSYVLARYGEGVFITGQCQNLARGGNLRKALRAPAGFKVVRVDASQIEARLTAWLAGETLLLEAFEAGRDPYSEFGTVVFGKPVSRETPVERHLAKAGVLGCGFYLGWKKFMRTTNSARLPDGNGGVISIDAGRAMQIVSGYRTMSWHVPQLWRMLNDVAIPCLAGMGAARMTIGPMVLERGRAVLPALTGELGAGLSLTYRDLQQDGTGEWTFAWGARRKKLYSGKLLENFVQALDRVLVIGAALRLQKLLAPYGLAQQAHDENVFIVPEEYSAGVGQRMQEEMSRRPSWGPDLPLAAEVRISDSYG